jgi:hypothetical protein
MARLYPLTTIRWLGQACCRYSGQSPLIPTHLHLPLAYTLFPKYCILPAFACHLTDVYVQAYAYVHVDEQIHNDV